MIFCNQFILSIRSAYFHESWDDDSTLQRKVRLILVTGYGIGRCRRPKGSIQRNERMQHAAGDRCWRDRNQGAAGGAEIPPRLELSIGVIDGVFLYFYRISICLYFFTIDFQSCSPP